MCVCVRVCVYVLTSLTICIAEVCGADLPDNINSLRNSMRSLLSRNI